MTLKIKLATAKAILNSYNKHDHIFRRKSERDHRSTTEQEETPEPQVKEEVHEE